MQKEIYQLILIFQNSVLFINSIDKYSNNVIIKTNAPIKYDCFYRAPRAPVAQLDRVLVFETKGYKFKSYQVHQ